MFTLGQTNDIKTNMIDLSLHTRYRVRIAVKLLPSPCSIVHRPPFKMAAEINSSTRKVEYLCLFAQEHVDFRISVSAYFITILVPSYR